ncbi:MAG: hypothetical protein V7641_1945 [Blastocatellia bacterium]
MGSRRPLWPLAIGFVFFSLLPASQAAAQYRFEFWTTDNGLPQNSICQIVQTPAGYLWLTTFDGLVRFDGVRFTIFDKSNSKAISSNRFTALYAQRDEALWAGTEDGGLVIYRDGGFTSYPAGGEFTSRRVYAIRPDPQGEPFISTPDGLFYLRDGQFIAAPPEYDSPTSRFYPSPSGALWILDQNGVRQSKNGRVTVYPIRLDFTHDLYRHLTCYEDQQGRLWFGDYGHLYALKDRAVTRYDQTNGLPPLPAYTVLRPYCEDEDGGLWLAAGRANQNTSLGLMRFKDGRFTVYGTQAGLLNNIVNYIFKDREGTIWIGVTGGLHRIGKQIITAYSTASGLLNKETYPLLETGDGDLLVGTIQGVSRFKNGRFSTVIEGGLFQNVQALWEYPTGRLWIGAIGGLLWHENGKLNLQDGLGLENNVWAIRSDRAGNLWVGTTQGLFKFRDRKLMASYTTKKDLPGDDVKVIHEAGDGTLWIGTYGGLAQLKDGKFISYTPADGLAGDHVRSIYEDADGTLWIGTYDAGLSRFRDGRFFNYKVENGLFNNGVFQILEDWQGRFWISCNKGIYRVSRQQLNEYADGQVEKLTCVAYGKADGMLNSECNGGRQPAGLKTADGKLWFPTMNGVVVIDPAAVAVNELPPPVVIEQVSINRSLVGFSKEVIVHPGQNDLEIGYAALSFIKPDQIKFKYRLEGKDSEWTDADTRRVAYYPYLPPGSYMFRIIAANQDGMWNLEGASLRIIVLAPFYERWWFLLLCAGAIAAVALLIVRRRVNRLQKKQAAQEAFSRQLIESQEQERKRIAAELHDSLGQSLALIKSQVLFGLNGPLDEQLAREQLEQVGEHTSRAIEEVKQIAHNLRPYLLDQLGLTRALKAMLKTIADSCAIELVSEIADIDGLLPKDAEINLYRIVQEAMNNVIKHSGASRARVVIEPADAWLTATIQDNGKGFVPEAATAVDDGHPPRRCFGLTGLAERAHMLGGKQAIRSALDQGTSVIVTVPLWREQKDERHED